jgi:hypothetical protein
MCGPSGYISLAAERADGEITRRTPATPLHRWPGDEGVYVAEPVALGQRRRRIIDLETGQQPITDEIGSVHVVLQDVPASPPATRRYVSTTQNLQEHRPEHWHAHGGLNASDAEPICLLRFGPFADSPVARALAGDPGKAACSCAIWPWSTSEPCPLKPTKPAVKTITAYPAQVQMIVS